MEYNVKLKKITIQEASSLILRKFTVFYGSSMYALHELNPEDFPYVINEGCDIFTPSSYIECKTDEEHQLTNGIYAISIVNIKKDGQYSYYDDKVFTSYRKASEYLLEESFEVSFDEDSWMEPIINFYYDSEGECEIANIVELELR